MNRYLGPDADRADQSNPAGHTPTAGIEASAPGYAVIVAALAAALVWSPATGDVAATVFIAGLASVALTLVEQSRSRARRGPRRVAGPRGLVLLVALGAAVVTGVAASFASVVAGQGALCLPVALGAFALVFAGTWLSEWDLDAATA
jgi:hypothetical protein